MDRIGRGRAAEVFRDHDAAGAEFARKVFSSGRLPHLVLTLLTGAGNPYGWCEAAIRAAFLRRLILSRLVACWFPGKLRLPHTYGWGWNSQLGAYELRCELVTGCHLRLSAPGPAGGPDALSDLVHCVMKPLQARLLEAGFDGLVWQAGLGNPTAANNFLLDGDGEALRWVWIDLESGVPALFSLDPLATVRFYLPRSLHHRRLLFDDVDVPRLDDYLCLHRERLTLALGDEDYAALLPLTADLGTCQREWRAAMRRERWRPTHLGADGPRAYRQGPPCEERADGVRPLHALASVFRFLFSAACREQVSRQLTEVRIRAWEDRGCLDEASANALRRELPDGEVSSYGADFAMHVAMQPVLRLGRWFLIPSLLAAGLLDGPAAGVLLFASGMIARTLYTAGRLIQAGAMGARRPWVALAVGAIPVLGNLAYPAQLAYRAAEEHGSLARFLLADAGAALGRAVPLWGGKGSLLEHYLSRFPGLLARRLSLAGKVPATKPGLP